MRTIKNAIAALAVATLLTTGAFAGSDLNEVGALLVYPTIVAAPGNFTDAIGIGGLETFVTITNAGPEDLVAHVSYINGEYDSYQYCYECDFQIPLTGNDTETLVVTYGPTGTHIVAEDLYLDMSCPWNYGMIVVAIEDPEYGFVDSDNVLLGEEVIVNYSVGATYSIPAIPFQGRDGGDGNRTFNLDDNEYAKMPRIVAADFLAPNINGGGVAHLSLFTLGFERQFPPLVDCSVIGFDADENPFSTSFQFGCWQMWNLCDISPEFCWPNLGVFGDHPYGPPNANADTHGWLQLNCRVDTNPEAADGFEANGGVHGAIYQSQRTDSDLAAGSGASFGSAAMWGRLLYQSVTAGDPVTLILEGPPVGMN